jgi:hypothetical protein
MKRNILGIIISCLMAVVSTAQNDDVADLDGIQQVLEFVQELSEEDMDLTQITQDLMDLKRHPINLNKASAQELEGLIFIHSITAQKIIDYRTESGAIRSYSELIRIDGIGRDLAKIIAQFTVLEKNPLENANPTNRTSSEINFLSFQKSPKSVGYKGAFPSFTGHPRRYLVRASTEVNSQLKIGLVLEQDAGEKWVSTPDFMSAYVHYKPNKTIFKRIVVGDYHLNYAQNLLMGPNFSFGKSLYMASWFRTGQSIKVNSSSAEYGYRRGVATEIDFKNWNSIVFASLEPIDFASDISSTSVSGLHRTESELSRRHNAQQRLMGTLNTLQFEKLTLGLGYISGGRSAKENSAQLHFDFASLNAKYRTQGGMLYTEVVRDLTHGMQAYHSGLIISLAPFLNFATIYKFYPHDFNNPFASAISSQSKAQNENGFLTGLEWKLSNALSVNGYLDHFKSLNSKELPSYQSENTDFLVQLKWYKKRRWEVYLRYRNRLTESDIQEENATSMSRHNTRLHYSYKPNSALRISQRLEYNFSQSQKGMLLYCDLQWRPKENPWAVDVRYTIFDVDSYDQRIYAFEASLPYTFSIPAYANTGSRSYIKLRYKGFKQCSIWVYYGIWKYTDIQQISSGTSLIESNLRREIGINVRYRI